MNGKPETIEDFHALFDRARSIGDQMSKVFLNRSRFEVCLALIMHLKAMEMQSPDSVKAATELIDLASSKANGGKA